MTDRLLTEKQAALILGMSVAWFQRKRWEGDGPPFVKFDRAVRYRECDLKAWVEKRVRESTSGDAGGAP